jgi:hypothetical protein
MINPAIKLPPSSNKTIQQLVDEIYDLQIRGLIDENEASALKNKVLFENKTINTEHIKTESHDFYELKHKGAISEKDYRLMKKKLIESI